MCGVEFDLRELGRGQLSWFEEDRVGDGELADVVKRCREPQQRDVLGVEAEQRRDQGSGSAYTFGVLEGLVVAVLGRECEPL